MTIATLILAAVTQQEAIKYLIGLVSFVLAILCLATAVASVMTNNHPGRGQFIGILGFVAAAIFVAVVLGILP